MRYFMPWTLPLRHCVLYAAGWYDDTGVRGLRWVLQLPDAIAAFPAGRRTVIHCWFGSAVRARCFCLASPAAFGSPNAWRRGHLITTVLERTAVVWALPVVWSRSPFILFIPAENLGRQRYRWFLRTTHLLTRHLPHATTVLPGWLRLRRCWRIRTGPLALFPAFALLLHITAACIQFSRLCGILGFSLLLPGFCVPSLPCNSGVSLYLSCEGGRGVVPWA